MEFEHKAMELTKENKIAFIAMSKKESYFKRHAVKFVLEQGYTPISQFGIFDYFLTDTIDRNKVREANNNLIRVSNEMWVFGAISDGVLAEIKMFKNKMPIRYFKIIKSKEIKEVSKEELEFEKDLEKHKNEL